MSKGTAFFLLALIIGFHGVNNFIIMENDLRPVDNEQTVFLRIMHMDMTPFDLSFIEQLSFFLTLWPPFLGQLFKIFHFIFGSYSLFLLNSSFLTLMVLSVYGIGVRFHGRAAGVLAATIVTMFPHIFGMSRVGWYDFPLTAMLAFSIFSLLMSDKFRSWKCSVLAGFSIGLCILLNTRTLFYILGPLAFYIIHSFMNNQGNLLLKKSRRYPGKILGLLLFCLSVFSCMVGAYLFLTMVRDYFGRYAGSITYANFGQNFAFILNWNFWAPLFFFQVSPVYALLLVFAVFFLCFTNRRKLLFLINWMLTSFVLLCFLLFDNFNVRYTLPILPAVALTLSLAVSDIKFPLARRVLVTLIVLTGLIQFVTVSYYPEKLLVLEGFARLKNSKFTKPLSLSIIPEFIGFSHEGKSYTYPGYRFFSGLLYAEDYDWEAPVLKDFLQDLLEKNRGKELTLYSFQRNLWYLKTIHSSLDDKLSMKMNLLQFSKIGFEHFFDVTTGNYDLIVLSNVDQCDHCPLSLSRYFSNEGLTSELYSYILSEYTLLKTISFPFENIQLFVYAKNLEVP